MREAFILASFKLQPKTGTSVFSLYNPRDNSKYFEFTVMGKLNRGKETAVNVIARTHCRCQHAHAATTCTASQRDAVTG